MIHRISSCCLFALPALLLFTGCGESDATHGLVERELSSSEKNFNIVDSSRERFRYKSGPAAGGSAGNQANANDPQFLFDTPEGWVAKEGSAMRVINFSLGENGEGECYVARLPGAGGGLLPNVNRWRAQMGVDPLTEEQVAALPKKPLFGQPAHYVAVDGSFTPGMGTTDTFPNYRLLGLILASDAGAVFVKMTGPKDLVTKNEAAFDQFTRSIDVKLN